VFFNTVSDIAVPRASCDAATGGEENSGRFLSARQKLAGWLLDFSARDNWLAASDPDFYRNTSYCTVQVLRVHEYTARVRSG
jgi:hypothetical protein